MLFRVQKLGNKVRLVRGYSDGEEIKFCFVCTFYRESKDDKWQVHGALSSVNIRPRDVLATYKFIEDFPGGTYTYVSKEDFERFYKKHYFTCVDCTKKKNTNLYVRKTEWKAKSMPLEEFNRKIDKCNPPSIDAPGYHLIDRMGCNTWLPKSIFENDFKDG